jgi:IclR family acetate operon transcriptional repressor
MSEIQSLRRAFDILTAIASNSNGVSLTEVALRVDLPKSTVSRMLSTLVALGAVEKLGGREGFRIGQTILAMASHTGTARTLIAIARPKLQWLAQHSGETTTLCVPDGDMAHYIDQANSPSFFQLRDWTGTHLPLHAAADGKLYLAFQPEPMTEAYLQRPMQLFTSTTIANAHAMQQEIAKIRKKGYAWDNGEYAAELIGVAAPIYFDSKIIASICIFGPSHRFPSEANAKYLIQQTIDTANAISVKLKPLIKPLD